VADPDPITRLEELAQRLKKSAGAEVDDLYLERTVDMVWNLADSALASRECLRREGAAVRRGRRLVSCDGLDRLTIAALTGLKPAEVPHLTPPTPPPPPEWQDLLPCLPRETRAARWRWRWAAVVRPDRACTLNRPQLLEVSGARDLRLLYSWPPAEPLPGTFAGLPPGAQPAPLPARVITILLAPPAAAVLLHELFGHPCEADLLAAGRSLWQGRLGERVLELPLTVVDDPLDISLPGAFDVDDEGEPAVCRPLLEDGRLVGVLADRRLAPVFGAAPGCARRAHIHAPPRPRMSNLVAFSNGTAVEPLRHEAQVEVTEVAGGTVDPASGRVYLAVSSAHTLRRGHPTRGLPPFTLSTTTSALERGILAAGAAAPAVAAHGWCGKDGEVLATGARTPWLLVDGMEIR